jgi:3',5'-cyclic AMP phosphodiesterase CpdA
LDRAQVQHYLSRQQRLHTTGVYRLFCGSLVESRTKRSDLSSGEYLGLTRQLQGHWDRDFYFLQLAAPKFGAEAVLAGGDGANVEAEERRLKDLVAAVNKLRPRFLVMVGDLTAAATGEGAVYDTQVEALRKSMARVSDTIPVLYCPGSHDVGAVPTPASLAGYRARFGADYFGFWYGGVRGLIINSSLLIHPEGSPEEAARQETWLTEEIEQSKLCSNAVLLFSYHPWFLSDIDEPDSEVEVPAGELQISSSTVR